MTITPRPVRRFALLVRRTLAEGADLAINARTVPSLRSYPYAEPGSGRRR